MNARKKKALGRNLVRASHLAAKLNKPASEDPFVDTQTVFARPSVFDHKACRDKRFEPQEVCGSRYKRHQLLFVVNYAQEENREWPQWMGRAIGYREVRRSFESGKLDVIRREHNGQIVTFFKERSGVRMGEPTPCALTGQHSAAMASAVTENKPQVEERYKLDRAERKAVNRVIVHPFEGPNPALTIYPAVRKQDVDAYKRLRVRSNGRNREYRTKARTQTAHYEFRPAA